MIQWCVCVFLTVTRSHSCVSCLSVESRAKHLHEKNQKALKNKTGWEVMVDGGPWCVLCIKCDVLEDAQAKDASSLFCFYFVWLLFSSQPMKDTVISPFTLQMHFLIQIICMSKRFQTADEVWSASVLFFHLKMIFFFPPKLRTNVLTSHSGCGERKPPLT